MKFALINGQRQEAQPNLSGQCPGCDQAMIAKCGEIKIWHWAHKGRRACDPWWENETEWHRTWKGRFPDSWQEVVQKSENGEKHIADVKTDSDWVLEFQHSPLKPEERRSRNSFYPKLVWVVDGLSRKRDRPKFQRILEEYEIRSLDPRFINILGPDDCVLLKEWHDSNALVFFDFQDVDDAKQPILWFLFPKITDNETYLWPISRDKFIELHNNNKFDELVEKTISPFIEKLINNENIKDEMEESRRRERLSRMNWITYGKRIGRY